MAFKQIERLGKRFLVLVLGFFLEREELDPEDVDFSSVKKILVVRQDDRIGNLILTTPLLLALRRFFPTVHVSYLASRTFHTLFENSSLVDEMLIAKKRQYIFHPLSLLSFIRKIRKQKFDLAFDSSDESSFSLNNSLVAYLSRATYRIGHKKPDSSLFLNLEVPVRPSQRHAAEMHLDLLRYLIGDFEGDDLRIEIDSKNRLLISKYLEQKGISRGDFLIGLNVGGRSTKRWGVENFSRLADWIAGYFGSKVIVIWGPDERKIVKEMTLKDDNKQILSDLFPLPVLAALIERCNLFITGDTGAMHLSAAVRTPTLALFLDSDPVKFGPRGKAHRIIRSSNGRISINTVIEALKDMMQSATVLREECKK